jgi:hypothetical protein
VVFGPEGKQVVRYSWSSATTIAKLGGATALWHGG